MSGKLNSFTALILDDDEEIIVEISEAIEMLGGKVDAFSNPLKCLEFLRCHHSSYDLVIVDLAMPVVNGVTFFEMASPYFVNSSKQFLITGLAELPDEHIGDILNFEVLMKPISVSELGNEIRRSLRL